MGRGIRGLGPLTVTVMVLAALTACGAPGARDRHDGSVYGLPVLGDWVEIDGRWDVTEADDDGHALLQAAAPQDFDGGDEDAPRSAGPTRWIDAATGDTLWERDDIGAVLHLGEDRLVAAVGSADARSVAAIALSTGEPLWSVPESSLGACGGWRGVAHWDSTGSSDDAQPRLVLRAPRTACTASERALLVELDPATGEHTEILRGRGSVSSDNHDGHLRVAHWRSGAATLSFYDRSGELVSSLDLTAETLLEGYGDMDLVPQVDLWFEQVVDDRAWLRVIWREDGVRHLLNDFLLDPVAGTATLAENDDCIPGGSDAVGYSYRAGEERVDSTSLAWCLVAVTDSGEAEVRTDARGGTSWVVPWPGAGTSGHVTGCAGDPLDLVDERMMLLAQAPGATVRAYDLFTGEVLWSLDGENPADQARVRSWVEANRAVVISGVDRGDQRLRVVDLCTGEVLDDREVVGADLVTNGITSSGSVLGVALEGTTLIARFHERGTRPETRWREDGV